MAAFGTAGAGGLWACRFSWNRRSEREGDKRTYSSAMVAVCLVGSRPSLDGPGYRRAKGLGLSRWLRVGWIMTLLRGPRCGWIGACRSGLGSTAKIVGLSALTKIQPRLIGGDTTSHTSLWLWGWQARQGGVGPWLDLLTATTLMTKRPIWASFLVAIVHISLSTVFFDPRAHFLPFFWQLFPSLSF